MADPRKSGFKAKIQAAAKPFAAFVILMLLAGFLFEQLGRRADRQRYSQIGRSVSIGGRTLNIFCLGEGSPAVVFDAAGHTAGYSWIEIQAQVAQFTRACWYDRAGYGWSDPGPSPRTFRTVARDLHALLRAAGVSTPVVLVGPTAAAFHIRVYNGLYPHEVAGAVLIHPADTDIFAHEPDYMKSKLASAPRWIQQLGCKALRPVLLNFGLLRLLGNPGSGLPWGIDILAPDQQRELSFLSKNPETAQTEGEGCVLDESMEEVRAAGDFGSRPLVILTSSEPFKGPPDPQSQAATDALNDFWFKDLQPRLARLSTRGQLVLQPDAEQPASIIHATREVVDQVRARLGPPPTPAH